MRLLPAALSTGLVAAMAASGHAQVVPDSTQRPDSATRLPRVAVTASRVPGALATAPFAADVRTRETIPTGTPALALDEALRGIPGVQVDNRYNFAMGERITIRGAGARAQFGVRGVRMLIDGIPATLPDGQTTLNLVDLTSLERVEIVRGPVASLFGNAAGGAILLETATAPRGVEASAAAGAHGLLRTRVAAGGANGRLWYAASASRLAVGGYRAHSDAENLYGAARIGWLGARDRIRISFTAVDYDASNPGSLSDSLLRVDRTQAFRNNVLQRTGERGRQQQGGALWQRAFGDDELEVTGWLIGRNLDNPIPARVVVIDRLAGGMRGLYRGAAGGFTWTAGVEREHQRDDRQNYVNQVGARGALVLDQVETVDASGAFAQVRAPLLPRISVLAGLRYDRSVFAADDEFVSDSDPDDSGSRTLAAVSPAAGIAVELPREVVLYANAGSAFETPTTTELANRPDGAGGLNPSLEPQRTVTYEIGAKRAAGSIAAQISVYRAFVRDALIPFEVPSVPDRQYFRNAGQTRTAGVESAVTVRPRPDWRIETAYTYTDARFRRYTVGTRSYEGNRVPGIAPHRIDATVAFAPRKGWIAADLRRQSATPVDDANDHESAPFTVLDARAGIRRGAFSVYAGVQNLLAAEYNASVVVNAFGRRYFEPGPSRTFHAGGSVLLR